MLQTLNSKVELAMVMTPELATSTYAQHIPVTDGPGTFMYNTPPTLSVTSTLNWYCRPPSSPDTTPEETLAGKVTDPELLCLLLPLTIL